MFLKIPKWDQDELGTPEFGNIKQVKFLDRINEKQKEKQKEVDDDVLFHHIEKNIYCCNNCEGKVIIN